MNFLYRSFFPIFFLVLLFFGLILSSKIREGFRLRRERLKSPFLPSLSTSFWIHAASGEYEYARPLVANLKQKYPHIPIVVTYFSPTYAKAIEKDPLVDYALPLPFDFPGAVSSFIKKIQPKAYFIARTDLWPEVLMQCQQRRIPSILFSYYQSQGKNLMSRFLRAWLLKKLTHIDCVNNETKRLVESMVRVPTSAFGDTRYDRVIERLGNPKALPFEVPQKKVIVLGSTWKEDEDQIFPALNDVRKDWELVIIAPHEPTKDHIKEIQKRCDRMGFSHELFSQIQGAPTKDILIVDQTGWLFDLYKLSSISFVGGSFKSTVHSVMEPLAHGSPLFLGPKIQNNAEALEFKALMFQERPAIQVTRNPDEIADVIQAHFTHPDHEQSLFKDLLKADVKRRSGASEQLLKHLEELEISE